MYVPVHMVLRIISDVHDLAAAVKVKVIVGIFAIQALIDALSAELFPLPPS